MAEVENELGEQTLEDSSGSSEIDRLTALLESELEQPEGEEESGQEADEAETVDAEFEEAPEEEAPEEEEVDNDPTDDSDEEKSEEMKFEVDGESLTAEELKLGYLRQSDYTKKTQLVAEQRKAFEAQTEQTEGQNRPHPTVYELNGKFILHKIFPIRGQAKQTIRFPLVSHHRKGIKSIPCLHPGYKCTIGNLGTEQEQKPDCPRAIGNRIVVA